MNNLILKTVYFGSAGKDWLTYKKLSIKQSTYIKYENLLVKHIFPHFSEMEVNEIDDVAISSFLLTKNNKLSISTFKSLYYIIQAVLKYVSKKYKVDLGSYEISLPKANSKALSITTEQQVIIEKKALQNKKEICHAILLGLYTGMRLGEICSLRWEDVDLQCRLIHVHQTVQRIRLDSNSSKTKLVMSSTKSISSIRTIPIAKPLLIHLSIIKDKQEKKFVISGMDKMIDPRKIQFQFNRVIKQSELKSINFHMLRHTFATNCIKKGIDVKSLSEILGHSNVNTTLNLYVHSSLEFKLKQFEKFDCFVSDSIVE